MDKFDKLIKEAVESYEAPYDAQVWANVSSQLKPKGNAIKWIAGSAAAVVLITGAVYVLQNDTPLTPEKTIAVENTVSGDQPVETDVLADQGTTNTTAGTTAETTQTGNENITHLNIAEPVSPTMLAETGNESGEPGLTPSDSEPSGRDNEGSQGTNNAVDQTVQNKDSQGTEQVNPVRVNTRFNTATTAACMTSEFIFTPEDINQSVLYVWDFGDGSFSSSKVGSHTYKRPGNFVVSLSLKDSKTNKTLGKSSMEVIVNPIPAVDFAYEKTNEMIPTITFINLTEDAVTWTWDIKGLKTSTENQFEYTFRKKGIYTVELTATNEFGCTNSTQKPIEAKSDYNLLAPTAFTPNGDNKNDYFIPEALRLMYVDFTMIVYDKAGSIMYQTNNVNQPWDGTNMNDNSQADDGAYVWQVQFKNANGETEYYEGQVIITR